MMTHESARGHVTGGALYTDDLVDQFPGILHAWPVMAPIAHAQLSALDVEPALSEPGVFTTLTADDVPGEGNAGANRRDEPLFPTEIMYHRQPVAWVLGETLEAARRGAERVKLEYIPLAPILGIIEAIAAEHLSLRSASHQAWRRCVGNRWEPAQGQWRAVHRRSGALLSGNTMCHRPAGCGWRDHGRFLHTAPEWRPGNHRACSRNTIG